MGIKTAIQWCDSTGNLPMGCDGCELWNPKGNVERLNTTEPYRFHPELFSRTNAVVQPRCLSVGPFAPVATVAVRGRFATGSGGCR